VSDLPTLDPEEFASVLPEVLKKAGDGAGVMMHDDDGRPMVSLYEPGKLVELLDDEYLFVFSMSIRPGALRFMHELEHTFFPPGTELNMKYSLIYVNWSQMMWIGVRIPLEMRTCADVTARRTGMRVANGVPTMIGGGGIIQFPLNGPHVYTLENESGSKVYDGQNAAEEMRKDEIMELNKENRR
jgi:hypothetical protein